MSTATAQFRPIELTVGSPMGKRLEKTLFSPARHKALYGGRGGGKSYAVATYLLTRAVRAKKRIVCARQFQNSIKDSSKELIEKRIYDLQLATEFTITDRTIVHNLTGSDFLFMGLERNIESIRSLEGADIVWIEEARTINARSMEILLPTVRKPGSQLIWTWNPEQPTDPVDVYFRGKDGPPPRSIVTRIDYNDNPFFGELPELNAEMEVLKRGNQARYRHVWLGEYDTRYESKVFPDARTDRVEVPGNCPPRYGMDFGFGSDPSFVVKLYVIEKTKQVYIAAEACGRVPMDQLPGMVRGIVHDDGDIVKADSSQPGTIEFMQARGLNVVGARKGQGSVRSGINFLQGYDIVIDPDCEQAREEFRLYSWMTDRISGKVVPGNPVDAYNHCADACRYAVEDLMINEALGDDDSGVVRLRW